ncbi:8807_t:CDS:2 [Funneliformis caledonium]|uniref:8807_t:CDS:1 n=1 Tax=Funneliformis caledonium TaxID=1117310 RepID=A0A9N9A0G9_9GLOM|nr:8807_t:CDS:2 [Funneliformis caledonium]
MTLSKNYNKSTQDVNQPILIIENSSDSWLEDFLREYNVKVVYGFPDTNANHNKLLTPKLVRDTLRGKKLQVKEPLSLLSRNEIIVKLLRFVLKDKAYYDLIGLPLVPVLNESHAAFGDKKYYLANCSERRLFPKYGPNVFVDDTIDQDMKEIFLNEDFQKANKIHLFDLNGFKKILKHELSKRPSLEWDPDSQSIPNRHWLKAIWDRILDFNCDLKSFDNFPLLPAVKPASPDIVSKHYLLALNSSNPLIRHPFNFNYEPTAVVLEKIGVHFTDFRKTEQLKPYIFDWNPQNVLRIIEKLRKFKDLSMERFLKPLDSENRESFRKFIMDNWFEFVYTRRKVQKEFYDILRQLPIWPTHSKEKPYESPKNGCLLPKGLEFYSPLGADGNYFDVESEEGWLALNMLNVPVISLNTFITGVCYHIKCVNPSDPKYMKFISSLLRLPLYMIPESLERFSIIPNESYTKLMRASELYDPCEELFREVFAGSDRFLPVELRSGWVLDGLMKLGLNSVTDGKSFIRVAEEIENLSRMPLPPGNLHERAKLVVRHFYYHLTDLGLTGEGWEKISQIKFVTSKPVDPPFLETAYSKVPELHSFSSLRLPKFKNICWTQCPIYDDDVLPQYTVNNIFPELSEVETQVVVDHLYTIRDIVRADVSEWKSSGLSELLHTVFLQIYQHLDQDPMVQTYLNLKLKEDPNIFLNGEDVFDPYNWVSAKQLVLNIDEDINSKNRAVNVHLVPFKRLLRICGVQEMKSPQIDMEIPGAYSQRDKIAISFARFLDEQSNSSYKDGIQRFHDIFFHIRGEVIGSSRYVLAASANYFERMFTSGTRESNPRESVHVNIDDIGPEAFRVMLKWLYGRSLEDALLDIKMPPLADKISFYLEIYIDLLNACEKYDLQELKRLIEHQIVKSDLIKAQNVLEVKKWAETYNAMQLFSYCKNFKEVNLTLLIRHRYVDLLYIEGDELSDTLDEYEDELGGLYCDKEESDSCDWDLNAELDDFEKNCGW